MGGAVSVSAPASAESEQSGLAVSRTQIAVDAHAILFVEWFGEGNALRLVP
jgi:hypothetical protein